MLFWDEYKSVAAYGNVKIYDIQVSNTFVVNGLKHEKQLGCMGQMASGKQMCLAGCTLTHVSFSCVSVCKLHICLCLSTWVICCVHVYCVKSSLKPQLFQESWIIQYVAVVVAVAAATCKQRAIFSGHLFLSVSKLFWQIFPCAHSMAEWFGEKEQWWKRNGEIDGQTEPRQRWSDMAT